MQTLQNAMFNFLMQPESGPPLDPNFRPPVLANHAFARSVVDSGNACTVVIAIERGKGSVSRFVTQVFPEDHPDAVQNLFYAERLIKFLLWQRGGWRLTIGGSKAIANHIQKAYAPDGPRAFDFDFMTRVYGRRFTVVSAEIDDMLAEQEPALKLGGHLDGQRIGFDLGASDLKVSAVVDGEAVFSTEIEWHPTEQTDPAYHRQHIQAALDLAAGKLSHVDAIGGSSAGVYVDNRPMVGSLYRGIAADRFNEVHNLFLDLQREWGVPLVVVNDGEVTALAGAMALEDSGVLGIAMGSSEAAGFVTRQGRITDWLNELAFAPVDYSPEAPVDEWSGDHGNGALYFSQQGVFRLASQAGIEIPTELSNAQKLKMVQEQLEAGHQGAAQIWETMGCYLGYTIAHYADFYDFKHVLILGRCTSGKGGPMMLARANRILSTEFPDVAVRIQLHLPDEKFRRVGQSIAAASLPKLDGQE